MRKTRKAAAVLTAVAMAAVSAAPVMADEIKDLYDYEVQTREIETWNILQSQLMSDTNVLTNLYDGLVEADEYGKLTPAIRSASLALGVLYAEGSRRYLDALSTYTRRRMTQASKAQVDEVLYVPAALALHQRPGVPGIRSTFGTGTELLNSLRLMYSRLAHHCCPNGHYVEPSFAVAAGKELVCPVCGAHFFAPSAEELAFNSQGACRTCD